MLLAAAKQLRKPLRKVVLQDEELDPMLVLANIKAEYLIQVAEDAVVQS